MVTICYNIFVTKCHVYSPLPFSNAGRVQNCPVRKCAPAILSDYSLYSGLSAYDLALFVEKRELFKIDKVVSILGVALGKDRHTSADDPSRGFHTMLKSAQRFSR